MRKGIKGHEDIYFHVKKKTLKHWATGLYWIVFVYIISATITGLMRLPRDWNNNWWATGLVLFVVFSVVSWAMVGATIHMEIEDSAKKK